MDKTPLGNKSFNATKIGLEGVKFWEIIDNRHAILNNLP